MLNYISAKEAAKKWDISQRRVAVLCTEQRIKGAMMFGKMWIIPTLAQKPIDKRTTRYKKKSCVELKPFVKWAGGKGQLLNPLNDVLSSFSSTKLLRYAEPMVGGGALFFHLLSRNCFQEYYISDINAELINCYQIIQSSVEELISRLNDLQTNFLPKNDEDRKSLYYSIRDTYNRLPLNENTTIEKAAYFIFLNKTCFNGLYRVNKKNQFNVPMGSYKNPTICDAVNLRNIHHALQRVKIVYGDYTLSKQFVNSETLVYLDPPYRPISATSAFNSYTADSFDDAQQIRLAKYVEQLNAVGAKIILSNSDPQNINPTDNFFDNLYQSYNIKRVDAMRAINSKGDSRGRIKELLIYN